MHLKQLNWLHGLRVQADLNLPCVPAESGGPDLVLSTGVDSSGLAKSKLGSRAPSSVSDRVALTGVDNGEVDGHEVVFLDQAMSIRRAVGAPRVTVRYPAVGLRFSIDSSGTPALVVASADHGEWLPWITVLVQGAVVAVAVAMSGRAAFHANTVDVAGQGILVGGASGAGKTVATALLVLAGHTLVADDVSVVDPDLPVRPGLLELRVRTWENPLGQLLVDELVGLPGTSQQETVDFRVAVRLGTDPHPDGVLPARMVLPTFDDETKHPRLETIRGAEAVKALLPTMRLVGWKDPHRQRADFGHCADLALRVPIQRLFLPRLGGDAPALLRDTAAELSDLIRNC